MPRTKKSKTNNELSLVASWILMGAGAVAFIMGLALLAVTFGPIVREEIRYTSLPKQKTLPPPKPVDPAFSIMVPKIGANSPVVANVDPFDENIYQEKLTKGVAHAKGTVFPGQVGNTFLFAHSARNYEIANQYNAVFYLLYKLELGDELFASYENNLYRYVVKSVSYVDPSEVKYLSPDAKEKTLTLMTCWPPGTTNMRLIVVATMAQGNKTTHRQ